MTINFITFGSHDNYIDAVNRLKNQAESLQLFDMIKGYTIDDLKEDEEFWNKHQTFFENNRMYGYCMWKPYIINKTIEKLNDGDILLYLDSGCELISNEKEHLLFYINEAVKKDKLFASYTPDAPEYKFCKMDLIHKLEMNNHEEDLNLFQIQAGFIFLEITPEIRRVINEWYYFASSDYHNIDDSPSLLPNAEGFIDHRHDQSIFSLLVKKNKLNICLICPWNLMCIKYVRNRTGISGYT